MQTSKFARYLIYIVVSATFVLLPTNIIKAQAEDRDARAYCKNKAQDSTEAHFRSSNIASARNNAAIGAVLGRSVGNTATGVGLGAALGSTSNRREKKEYYQREYDDCMRNNGG